MIRAVLVGYSTTEWKLFRQPQWMAEVRRNPQDAGLPKRYFDIEETSYREVLDRWKADGVGSDLDLALKLLSQFGVSEVTRP